MNAHSSLERMALQFLAGSLSRVELKRLDRLLAGSSAARRRFAELVEQEIDLREVLSINEAGFGDYSPRSTKRRGSPWIGWVAPLAGAAAAALAVGVALWFGGGRDAIGPAPVGVADAGSARAPSHHAGGVPSAHAKTVAYAASVQPGAQIQQPGSDLWETLSAEAELIVGTKIKTSASSTVEIAYKAEESRVCLDPNTILELRTANHGGKLLALDAGRIDCSVARQPEGQPLIIRTPQAELKVVGTRFGLGVSAEETHLEVVEGLVQMGALGSKEVLDVEAGNACVASKGDRLSLWGRIVLDEDFSQGASNWVVVVGKIGKVYEINDPEVADVVKLTTRRVDGRIVPGLLLNSSKAKDKQASLSYKRGAAGSLAIEFEFSTPGSPHGASVVNAGCSAIASDNTLGKQTVVYDAAEKLSSKVVYRRVCEYWYSLDDSRRLTLESLNTLGGREIYRQHTLFNPGVSVVLRPTVYTRDVSVFISKVTARELKSFVEHRGNTAGEQGKSEVTVE